MRLKKIHPSELAVDLLSRSKCNVQVAAVLADKHGIFAWGHNHSGGDGFGCHAEKAALFRANRKRLKGAIMFVAARRRKSGSRVIARPCEECAKLVKKVGAVMWRDKTGEWRRL